MFLIGELPEGEDVLLTRAPARPQRSKVHPLTWIAAAALMPVLAYDVWQTLQDVRHRHQAYPTAASVSPSAAARLRGPFE